LRVLLESNLREYRCVRLLHIISCTLNVSIILYYIRCVLTLLTCNIRIPEGRIIFNIVYPYLMQSITLRHKNVIDFRFVYRHKCVERSTFHRGRQRDNLYTTSSEKIYKYLFLCIIKKHCWMSLFLISY